MTVAEAVAGIRASGEDVLAVLDRFEAMLARPAWHAQARCRGYGPKAFFTIDATAAKATCAACPVRRECAEAGEGHRFGTWGGVGERERRETTGARRGPSRQRLAL